MFTIQERQVNTMSVPFRQAFVVKISEHLLQASALLETDNHADFGTEQSFQELDDTLTYLQQQGFASELDIIDAMELIQLHGVKRDEPQVNRIFRWQEYSPAERIEILHCLREVRKL